MVSLSLVTSPWRLPHAWSFDYQVMPEWHSSCMVAFTGSTFHKGLNTNCVCWPSNAFTNLFLDICRGTANLQCHLSLVGLYYDLQLLVNLWFHFQKLKLSETKGFVISGPSTRNSLSSELHDKTMSLFSFKKHLKTFLFWTQLVIMQFMQFHLLFI